MSSLPWQSTFNTQAPAGYSQRGGLHPRITGNSVADLRGRHVRCLVTATYFSRGVTLFLHVDVHSGTRSMAVHRYVGSPVAVAAESRPQGDHADSSWAWHRPESSDGGYHAPSTHRGCGDGVGRPVRPSGARGAQLRGYGHQLRGGGTSRQSEPTRLFRCLHSRRWAMRTGPASA